MIAPLVVGTKYTLILVPPALDFDGRVRVVTVVSPVKSHRNHRASDSSLVDADEGSNPTFDLKLYLYCNPLQDEQTTAGVCKSSYINT